jgi:hypothetical protein
MNPPATKGTVAATLIAGGNLTVEKISLRFTPNGGLAISGDDVIAQDILVECVFCSRPRALPASGVAIALTCGVARVLAPTVWRLADCESQWKMSLPLPRHPGNPLCPSQYGSDRGERNST